MSLDACIEGVSMDTVHLQDVFSLSESHVRDSRFKMAVSSGSALLHPASTAAASLNLLTAASSDPLRLVQPSANHQLTNGADESLADLQPEDSDSEEESRDTGTLTSEQQKVEFMASLGLVPPAVLEEIQRRQELCRVEYGNWWDRLHSTDFCLVPKNENVLQSSLDDGEHSNAAEYPIIPVEDQSQVAAGPDAGSLVEQITYLTSWPQSDGGVETQEVVEATPISNSLC